MDKVLVKKLLLIDADSLCYKGNHKESTIQDILSYTDETIATLVKSCKADYYALFISEGKYFRHSINPDYKGNRDYSNNPQVYIKVIKEYLKAEYGANSSKLVEADDLVAYWYNHKLSVLYDSKDPSVDPLIGVSYGDTSLYEGLELAHLDVTFATIDKDLLKRIEGIHINYYNNKESSKPYSFHSTSKKSADLFKIKQLLMGDSADNILSPINETCADYLLETNLPSKESLIYPWVLNFYINGAKYLSGKGRKMSRKGLGEEDGLARLAMNSRQLNLLDSKEVYEKEGLEAPTSFKFKTV